MELRGFWLWFDSSKPYLFLTLNQVCLAVFLVLVQSILSKDVNGLAFVVYENIVSTIFISLLAFFIERQKRPPISFKIIGYAFLLGLLEVPLCQMLLTISLKFVDSAYQSIGLNLKPAILLFLTVVLGQEKLKFWSRNGQAKLWGVTMSAAGVMATVLWQGPSVVMKSSGSFHGADGQTIIGAIMIVIGVLSGSFWNLLVGNVTKMYPATLSVTAMMMFFGTIQASIITAILIPRASWKLQWDTGLVLLAILFGGIVITGLSNFVLTWGIHIRGPVFASAFLPLLIVFSFLLDTFVLGDSVHLGSIIGAFLVVVGFYLILWAKADDRKKNEIREEMSFNSPLIQP